MRLAPPAAALLALLIGSGCGDDEVALVEGVGAEVKALDNVFEPPEMRVAAGTEVAFTNDGRNDHNVLPAEDPSGAFRLDVADFPPGESTTFRLTEPGTYRYFCSIHGTASVGMIGTIVVTEGREGTQ